jgi:hypothetical protein
MQGRLSPIYTRKIKIVVFVHIKYIGRNKKLFIDLKAKELN